MEPELKRHRNLKDQFPDITKFPSAMEAMLSNTPVNVKNYHSSSIPKTSSSSHKEDELTRESFAKSVMALSQPVIGVTPKSPSDWLHNSNISNSRSQDDQTPSSPKTSLYTYTISSPTNDSSPSKYTPSPSLSMDAQQKLNHTIESLQNSNLLLKSENDKKDFLIQELAKKLHHTMDKIKQQAEKIKGLHSFPHVTHRL
jgi:hypothetical protein